MRLSAYKKAIDEAKKLPNQIVELNYFSSGYSPRDEAVNHIINKARLDGALFTGELVELYNYNDEN